MPDNLKRVARFARAEGGMTLIEMMVVIMIIGLVASLVGVAVFNRWKTAQIQATKIQIKNFGSALEHYKLAVGHYPTNAEGGLQALLTPPKGEKAFMTEIPKDPWGSDYVYICPGMKNSDSFDLKSYGEDGVEGGSGDGEDIGNY